MILVSEFLESLHISKLEYVALSLLLNWIVYRPDDSILISTNVYHEFKSDYWGITYQLDLSNPDPPTRLHF